MVHAREDPAMNLSLHITPVGNTTPREIAAASNDVRRTLERLPGVTRVAPLPATAPAGAKAGLIGAIGELAMSLAPTAIKEALQAVLTVLAQRPQTKVVIESKDAKVSFEFDPKRITLQELVAAAEKLRAAPQAS
jgi:hypothetical protein